MKNPMTNPMKKMNKTLLTAALAAGLSITAGSVLAESQYGYNSDGKDVSAQANVKLKITVPNLILLRVGSDNGTIDELAWAVGASSPKELGDASNKNLDWDGSAPILEVKEPDALEAMAWTNGSSATLNCAMGDWNTSGGPASSDFIVTSDGKLPHPGENLGACQSVKFESNVVLKSAWKYVLKGTPTSWKAGVYTNTVTYTASSV